MQISIPPSHVHVQHYRTKKANKPTNERTKRIQVPPRKRRLVTYKMQPLSEQPGHRFGVNRILRLGEDSLLSAGRDGVVRRWDVSSMLGRGGSTGTGRRDGARLETLDKLHCNSRVQHAFLFPVPCNILPATYTESCVGWDNCFVRHRIFSVATATFFDAKRRTIQPSPRVCGLCFLWSSFPGRNLLPPHVSNCTMAHAQQGRNKPRR